MFLSTAWQEHRKLQRLRKKASRLSATDLQEIAVVKGLQFPGEGTSSSASSGLTGPGTDAEFQGSCQAAKITDAEFQGSCQAAKIPKEMDEEADEPGGRGQASA